MKYGHSLYLFMNACHINHFVTSSTPKILSQFIVNVILVELRYYNIYYILYILQCLYRSWTSKFLLKKKNNSCRTSCQLYETDQCLWNKKAFVILRRFWLKKIDSQKFFTVFCKIELYWYFSTPSTYSCRNILQKSITKKASLCTRK